MISLWFMGLLLIGDRVRGFSAMTGNEGSCVTIRILHDKHKITEPRYITWLKNAKWNDSAKDFKGTVVYSLEANRPAESKFKDRVSATGPDATGTVYELTIHNLTQEDRGSYSVRYYGVRRNVWSTEAVILEVKKNPCKVHVTGPELVQMGAKVSLRCSTWGHCGDSPEWRSSGRGEIDLVPKSDDQGEKTALLIFTAEWSDDGATFSCWPPQSTEACASRNVTLTVEYSPRDTRGEVDSDIIKEGGDVTFTCHSRGNPRPSFSWFKVGGVIPTQGGEWKLPGVQIEHAGSYICHATNKHGAQKSTAVTLDVTYDPKGVSISPSVTLDQVTEGDAVNLTCIVQSSNPKNLSYSWYKNDALLGETGQVLRFRAVRPKDRGPYSCRASNSEGWGDSPMVPVSVSYGPISTKIKTSCCEKGVKAGQSLTLSCEADAHPQPNRYTWFHAVTPTAGGRTQSWTEVRARFDGWTDQRALSWEHIRVSDAGEYMCRAANKIAARNSSSLRVDVLYRPTGLNLSMAPTVTESSLVTVRCTAESFPLSLLNLTWPVPSDLLSDLTPQTPNPKPLPRRSTIHSASGDLVASFTASIKDAGLYTCQARNSEGQDEVTRELVVHYAPREVRATANPRGEVTEKTNVELTCEARSNPNVTEHTWFRLRGGEAREAGPGPVLTLRDLSAEDTGLYFCRARNVIGEGNSSAINVTVIYGPKKPVIIHNMTSRWQSVKESAVALSCSSQSYPPIAMYKWYILKDINAERFVRAEQNLTIGSEEGGIYYCFVKNRISSSSSDKIEIRFYRSSAHILIMASMCFLLIIFIFAIIIIVLVYRKRRKSTQRSLGNGSWNGTWETLVMDGMGDTQQSRETLSGVVAPPPRAASQSA
ncbi:hypothetical protein SKAU_G00418390 [Synaphobranchus kaupii]|uniref:B-cell receptor CD22 n=1 Tax=Synaphobranchus kaupii TaxID=118154 RepID=A0A9Q1E630_SYNKA|nr:hypothetical protein SKAU_G00418390 [Synaphobranchus kaupii]